MSGDATLLRDLGRWGDTTMVAARQLVGLQVVRPVQRGPIRDRELWVVVGMAWAGAGRRSWRLRSLDRPHAPEEAHHPCALADEGAWLYRCASTGGVVDALLGELRYCIPTVHAYDERVAALAGALRERLGDAA